MNKQTYQRLARFSLRSFSQSHSGTARPVFFAASARFSALAEGREPEAPRTVEVFAK